jgi:protein prenyltransferase alpha subunit repeat containing protein 1
MYLRAVWSIGDDHLRDSLKASITHLPACKYRENCVSWCKQFG